MISLADMRKIAAVEKEAEDKAKQAKFQRDLAMYRERYKKVIPDFIEYIQKGIVRAIKCNQNELGLYRSDNFEKIFASVHGANDSGHIFYYLGNPNYSATPDNAYEAATKEAADSVREELFSAGIKDIKEGEGRTFVGHPDVIIHF